MNRKGAFEDYVSFSLIWYVVGGLALGLILYLILSGKVQSALEFIKNIGFGR